MTSSPACRAVRRGRGRRVAGRGADDRPGARLDGLGDRHDHAAVLERAGRVLALDLEVQVRGADRLPEPLGADERRGALAQRQRRRRVGHRQEAAVALHQPRSGRSPPSSASSVIDGVERDVDAVGQDARRRRPGPRPGSRPRCGSRCRPRTPTAAASSSAVGQRPGPDRGQEREPVAAAVERVRGRDRRAGRRRQPGPGRAEPAGDGDQVAQDGAARRRRRRRPAREARPCRAARRRSRPGS